MIELPRMRLVCGLKVTLLPISETAPPQVSFCWNVMLLVEPAFRYAVPLTPQALFTSNIAPLAVTLRLPVMYSLYCPLAYNSMGPLLTRVRLRAPVFAMPKEKKLFDVLSSLMSPLEAAAMM